MLNSSTDPFSLHLETLFYNFLSMVVNKPEAGQLFAGGRASDTAGEWANGDKNPGGMPPAGLSALHYQ
jgi:hypothetical protein